MLPPIEICLISLVRLESNIRDITLNEVFLFFHSNLMFVVLRSRLHRLGLSDLVLQHSLGRQDCLLLTLQLLLQLLCLQLGRKGVGLQQGVQQLHSRLRERLKWRINSSVAGTDSRSGSSLDEKEKI